MGLTGSRTWEVGPRVDGTATDNGDCDSLNWAKFQSNTLPVTMGNYLVYIKNKIVAKGYQPSFYSSPGYPTHATDQKPWVMYNPGERAQQIWGSALYMKNTYGININYAVIYNEPSGLITSTILADDIKALGPRLVSHGLITKSQFAEAVAPQTDWNLITPVQSDADLWPWVGRLSYHNYGTADPYRSYIRDYAGTLGITTAQTEMASPTFDELYSDMILGGVSYWEVAYSSSNTLVNNSGLTTFLPSGTFIRLHQVIHYVTPGSTRIQTTSNDTLLHVLAFTKAGTITTIIDNTSSTHTVTLTGLPQGTYGLSYAAAGATFFTEAGLQTVGAGGTLTVTANGGGTVTTLYPYTGPNHAPDIMTWTTSPGYLVLPTSTATLTANASDAEANTLTYHWTVFSHPAGANSIALASQNAASTSVSGLSVAGTYIFNIDVLDGANTSSKKVYLVVYAANPQPVLGQTGFRIATPYGLVFGDPTDTTHANIELPTSGVTVQTGISDLANSNFTGQGTWSLVSQPAGANITLSATTYIYVSLRATVTNMTIAGDYVFRINVLNPGHPDLTAIIKCTVHPASSAPVIGVITPTPSSMTLPVSSTHIVANTSDPDGDLLRYWWVVKTVPSGTHPIFNHQGLAVTDVSGLTTAGSYTFTLRAFDDLHMTTKDVTVTVLTCPGGIPAQPGSISGLNTVCMSVLGTYSISAVTGASSYTWTLPAGWSGASTTNSISVTTGTTGGTISVVANNSCGTSPSQTLSVSVSTCATPTNISAGSITGTGATISWIGNDCAAKYRVQYRVQGATAWITKTVNAPILTKILVSLTELTTYEFHIRTDCNTAGTIASAYSYIQTFTTICSCAKPTNISVAGITQTSSTVSWAGNVCAYQYRIQNRKQGTTAWTTKTVLAPTVTKNLTGLIANTVYEYKMRTDCNSSGTVNLGWTTTQTFTTALRLEDENNFSVNKIFSVYPNPCSMCEITGSVNAEDLIVTDILGREIFAQFIQLGNNFYFSMPDESASGLYLARNIRTGQVVKFVKQ